MGFQISFIFSPRWFYGIDSILEVFSIIVALVIAYHTYRLYKFSGKNNYKYFSLAFLMFALGLLFKVIINLAIYYNKIDSFASSNINIFGSTISQLEFISIAGYLGFRMLFLLGLMGIYSVSYKNTSFNDLSLYSFFFFVVCFFSHYIYKVFHFTAIAFLLFIVVFYYKNYLKRKNTSSMLVFMCFLLFLISQILFIPTLSNSWFYVAAELFQFLGFLSLMIANIILIRK